MISPNQSILPHYILNHHIHMNPPSSTVNHHLLHPPSPRCHPPRSLQLALVQVGVSGEQVACGGQDDSHHPPALSRVRMARGGALRTGDAVDSPSSWRGRSVGVCYLHMTGGG